MDDCWFDSFQANFISYIEYRSVSYFKIYNGINILYPLHNSSVQQQGDMAKIVHFKSPLVTGSWSDHGRS